LRNSLAILISDAIVRAKEITMLDLDSTAILILVIILVFAADCNDTKIQKIEKSLQRIESILDSKGE